LIVIVLADSKIFSFNRGNSNCKWGDRVKGWRHVDACWICQRLI